MVDKNKAVMALYSNAVEVLVDNQNNVTAYDADGNQITLDNALIDAWVDPEAYKYARESEYESVKKQLDMMYWDRVNGTSTWKEHIDAVKAAHPKPTE